ncbi:MAG: adenylyltransferase/cytidyltransferase family protein [Microbacterium sp.]|nr:adenylyltransferase/cytidyltransferase family protein [Microbacterium sp.]
MTRIGYAAGAFDLFHVGHLNLLKHAKANCDILIAGVVSDEMLRQVKGVEPVIPTAERAAIVRHISFVDDVHVETVPDKIDTWREVGFTHFFKGDDWRGTDKGRRLEREFASVGVEVVVLIVVVAGVRRSDPTTGVLHRADELSGEIRGARQFGVKEALDRAQRPHPVRVGLPLIQLGGHAGTHPPL